MKVFLCGNKETTYRMVNCLRDKSIAYTCVNFENDDDTIETKRILESICNEEDYLFVTDEKQYNTARSVGVPNEKILRYELFDGITFYNPIADFNEKVDSLIFGMSHSQTAIDTKKLTGGSYYKVASPSMDMYLHTYYLHKLIQDRPEELIGIKSIIVEMPYYIFN